MQQSQSDYITKDLQFVTINKAGTVLSSDQRLFELKEKSSIKDFHPLFEGLEYYFESNELSLKLECVAINERIFDIDFIIKDKENALVIFREGTDFYNRIQVIAQKRNESMIFQESLELKNQILKENEEFKNRFIGNFSHELRNPLTLVSSFSSMLLKTELNLNQEMLVGAVREQSDKLRDILDDIIDLSILKSSTLTLQSNPFSLRKLFKKIHANYTLGHRGKGLEVHLNIAENLPKTIIGDKRRFEQIVTNFIDNALRLDAGYVIEINVLENQRRANKVSLRIEVIHKSGIITATSAITDLEPFTKLENGDIEKTTGLSFSIAREIAQLMDGDIFIKPMDGGGTIQAANLKLTFPIHDKEIEEEIVVVKKNKKVLSQKIRTIVAEDSNVTQMTALKVLISTGNFDTQVFSDPKNLLAIVGKEEVDLILMSSSISQIDAIELISLIKEFANEHNKKIPIIALTTKTAASEIAAYRKAGFKEVVKKPYTDDELLDAIYKKINLKKFK